MKCDVVWAGLLWCGVIGVVWCGGFGGCGVIVVVWCD